MSRADQASRSGRSLYVRMLRVQHLRLRPLMVFVLFEGSAAAALLLALAELIPWWGMLVIPAVVAAMVKFNDVVAGTLAVPVPVVSVPVVSVPVASAPAAWAGRARGVAPVCAQGRAPVRRPSSGPGQGPGLGTRDGVGLSEPRRANKGRFWSLLNLSI